MLRLAFVWAQVKLSCESAVPGRNQRRRKGEDPQGSLNFEILWFFELDIGKEFLSNPKHICIYLLYYSQLTFQESTNSHISLASPEDQQLFFYTGMESGALQIPSKPWYSLDGEKLGLQNSGLFASWAFLKQLKELQLEIVKSSTYCV